jgi:type IV secretory pathway TrbD component
MYAGLYSDIQNLGIKSLRDNIAGIARRRCHAYGIIRACRRCHSMIARHTLIPGYEAPILRGVWERPQRMGAPRLWGALWMALCLYGALIFLTVVGFKMALLPLLIWAIGQGALVALTQWDQHWDDVMIAQFTRRYKAVYEPS